VVSSERGRYTTTDQHSTNGTWINGRRSETAPLRENDRAGAGSTRFRFEIGAATMLGEVEMQASQKFQDALQDICRKAERPPFTAAGRPAVR